MAAHASLCVKQCAASMMNALTGRAASGMSSGTTVKSTLAVATAAATTTTTTTTTPKLLPYEAMGRRHFGSNIPETGFFSEVSEALRKKKISRGEDNNNHACNLPFIYSLFS